MPPMTRAALLLAATLLPAPASAQEAGDSLIDQGAQLLLRGLIEEVAPPLEDLAGLGAEGLAALRLLVEETGPAWVEVLGQVDSIANYEPPAFLPDGDIILRRSADAPPWVPPGAEPPPAAANPPEGGPEASPEPLPPPPGAVPAAPPTDL